MIDAHAHLTDPRLGNDLDAVLARAAAAGVRRILAVGEDVPSSAAAVALAQRASIVRAAVGIHPHRAHGFDSASLSRLRELARDDGVVAVGEIGIDLSGRSAPRDAQERAFAAQLELAAELSLPVSLHVRESGPVVRATVDRVRGLRGYVHCFSEGPDDVGEWIDRGLFVSFAGTLTYPGSAALRTAASRVPSDRLLVETDAPVLAPQPHRGRRNEPAYIAATYACLAELRGTSAAGVAEAAGRNAAVLFGPRWSEALREPE